jgi:hypothetical protein
MTVRIAMIGAGLLASFAGFAGVEVHAGTDKIAFQAKGDLHASIGRKTNS